MAHVTLATLNGLDRDAFVDALGSVFEASPWVPASVVQARPFDSVEALHGAMARAVRDANEERQLALIRAHPDLAGKAARAGEVTDASSREQAGAGLDRLGDEEYARFHWLNDAYRRRFGFPFVLAVAGHGKQDVLASFEARLGNDAGTERARALAEIEAIAWNRLQALVME